MSLVERAVFVLGICGILYYSKTYVEGDSFQDSGDSGRGQSIVIISRASISRASISMALVIVSSRGSVVLSS